MDKIMRKYDKPAEMEKQTDVDRISNLPWDVLDTILVNLPLRDAARTSILSSKWRYKWTGISQYVFNDNCISSSLMDKADRWVVITKVIDQIRSNHRGPIEKFKLSAYCCPNYSDLDQWITFLTSKGIKELIIQDFVCIRRFKLPSSVFFSPKLSCLELYGCIFKLPSFFKGFDYLKSFKLSNVSITSDTLESLISSCPVLERLMLLRINHLAFVRIHNPNLKYLKIDSEFQDICLRNCPLLATVDIRMIPANGRIIPQPPEQGQVCNFTRVLGCLSGVNRLSLSSQFLEFLVNEIEPQRLPTLLSCLSSLDLKEVTFTSLNEITVSIALLRSSPNLADLVMTVGASDEDIRSVMDFIRAQCLYDFYFDKLKSVKIRGILGTMTEWLFIKLILAHSPVLESMTIVQYSGERISKSLLLEAERASQHVKFISLTL